MGKSLSQLSKEVALRVKLLRGRRELTQEQLSEAAGISRDALSRIELMNRSARLDTLAAIADALDVEVSDLVGGEAAPRPTPRSLSPSERSALRSLRAMSPIVAKNMVRALALVARAAPRPR